MRAIGLACVILVGLQLILAIQDSARLAKLAEFMKQRENKGDQCSKQDMDTIEGVNEAPDKNSDNRFVSRFYYSLFTCARKPFVTTVSIMDCVLKTVKKEGYQIQPSCIYCFVEFIGCARSNCSFKCAMNVCSRSCVDCCQNNCMSDLEDCTGKKNIPQACKEIKD